MNETPLKLESVAVMELRFPPRTMGSAMASANRARMGLGLIFQCVTGLRLGELIHLVKEDFQISPEAGKGDFMVVRLGTAVGTKVQREQCILFDIKKG